MPAKCDALKIRKSEHSALEKLVRSTGSGAGLVRRARIIVLAGEGISNRQIAERVGCKPHIVKRWRDRYQKGGIKALADRARSGRPPLLSAKDKQRIVTRVCSAPPRGLSRWSVRTLARECGHAPSVIHGVLQEHDLHPHRLRTFNFSPDPRFEEKLLEVVGLYMKPPENAVVLCVDEKTGIQALDRTQAMLPLRAGKPRAWSNEYVRHGTRTMLAALELKTGKVTAHVRDNRRSETFLEFMDAVVARHRHQRLCVVLDNLNTHNNDAATRWLAAHPRVSFHYSPTHASWVNLIECFFSIMTKQALQQAVHRSGRELQSFLNAYVRRYNKTSGPFTWTKGPDKLRRIIQLTKKHQAACATN
jgi:transposase